MKKTYYTYVLKSLKSGKIYIGQTNNLKNRMKAHNEGLSPYTKGRGPWKLIYHESFTTRAEAMAREKYFKTGKGKEFLKTIIDPDLSD
jgi:putative endonuclease